MSALRIAIAIAIACMMAPNAAAQSRPPRHAAHAGQHGGLVVPVWNDTLHAEGVWQEQRRFRVYLSDTSGLPLLPEQLEQVRGNVVEADRIVAPLHLSADGAYLEARIGSLPIPAVITFVLTRHEDGADERIAMMFSGYSEERPSFDVPPTEIPTTRSALADALRRQAAAAIEMARSGEYGEVYRPATHTRDLLLALAREIETLPVARRSRAEAAIREAVRVVWLLHVSGDLGAPAQTRAAADALRDACNELSDAFDGLFARLS